MLGFGLTMVHRWDDEVFSLQDISENSLLQRTLIDDEIIYCNFIAMYSLILIYTPGQNKRNTLFCLLFLPTIVVWSDIYITDTYSITRLMLKVSALKNKNWWRKVPIYLMYWCANETKIWCFINFYVISNLISNFGW